MPGIRLFGSEMKNKIRWLVLLAAVAAVVAVVVWKLNRNGQVQHFTAKVERGDIKDVVEATGTINAVITVQVGSQVSGTIAKLNADYYRGAPFKNDRSIGAGAEFNDPSGRTSAGAAYVTYGFGTPSFAYSPTSIGTRASVRRCKTSVGTCTAGSIGLMSICEFSSASVLTAPGLAQSRSSFAK